MKKLHRCASILLLTILLVGCTSVKIDEMYDKFISQLAEEKYYALLDLEDVEYPVLFVTDNVYEYEEGIQAAISCEVYYMQEGKFILIGELSSEGTAYPIVFNEQGVYTAGHHFVGKYDVDENQGSLFLEEYAEEVFEERNGKETYFYTINGVKESVENRRKLEMMFEQYEKADTLNFRDCECFSGN